MFKVTITYSTLPTKQTEHVFDRLPLVSHDILSPFEEETYVIEAPDHYVMVNALQVQCIEIKKL